jgi:hypothetical protein
MQRNKMKKIVALVAVLFSVVVPVQAHATVGERIVIIDSYFDKTKVTGSVEFVCLATDKCVNTPTPKPGLGTDAANHGTVMANIARQQNATATLVLIQTEEVSTKGSVTTLDGSDFIKALTWVNANKTSVSAVSFSYNLTNSNAKIGECKISAQGGVVGTMDSSIKSLVASLKSSGIPVLAAAGNFNNKPLQYPACLTDVVSVGSTGSATYYQSGVKIVASIVNPDNTSYMKSVSPWFGSVDFTTSAATVAVASNWKSIPAGINNVKILSN